MWVTREALATPLASRDPMLRRFLETHAQRLLESLPARVDPIVGQIREAVIAELATSGADLARVAKRVAMSKRTVQRRLEEAGTNYQDLVDEVRAATRAATPRRSQAIDHRRRVRARLCRPQGLLSGVPALDRDDAGRVPPQCLMID